MTDAPQNDEKGTPEDLMCVGRFGKDGLDGMGALAGEDIYVTKEAHARATGEPEPTTMRCPHCGSTDVGCHENTRRRVHLCNGCGRKEIYQGGPE